MQTDSRRIVLDHPLIKEVWHGNPGNWEYSVDIRVAESVNRLHRGFRFCTYYRVCTAAEVPMHVWPLEIRPLMLSTNGEISGPHFVAHDLSKDELTEALSWARTRASGSLGDDFQSVLQDIFEYAHAVRELVRMQQCQIPWFTDFFKERKTSAAAV